MRRRLINLATILSLVLLVATVALWVRSYWRTYDFTISYRGDGLDRIRARRGTLSLMAITGQTRQGIVNAKFRSVPDDSASDERFTTRGLSIRHEWHQFSYDTVPKLEIVEAEYRRHVLMDREVRATRFLEQPNLDPQTVANLKWSQASDQYNVMVLSDIPRKPHWRVVAPAWPLVVIWMMPGVVWLVSGMTRRIRRKKGFCAACGYNLTGNVSGVCPECGSKVRA